MPQTTPVIPSWSLVQRIDKRTKFFVSSHYLPLSKQNNSWGVFSARRVKTFTTCKFSILWTDKSRVLSPGTAQEALTSALSNCSSCSPQLKHSKLLPQACCRKAQTSPWVWPEAVLGMQQVCRDKLLPQHRIHLSCTGWGSCSAAACTSWRWECVRSTSPLRAGVFTGS